IEPGAPMEFPCPRRGLPCPGVFSRPLPGHNALMTAPTPSSPDGPGFRLPLFPLQTVLFPDGLLTLKVFEVRCLDMISRCHEDGSPFGVVGLTAVRELRDARCPREAFHGVGTLAQILCLERTHPGLLTIRCRGTQRLALRAQEQFIHGL